MPNASYNPNAPETVYPGYLGTGSNPAPAAPPSTPITSAILAPQSAITPPQPNFTNNSASTNASIPTPQSIINQTTQPTGTDNKQSDLLNRLAVITGNQSSLATQQNAAYNNAGLQGLARTVNDLSTHLQGLNDQATTLQMGAAPGGTIQNNEQNNVLKQGNITTSAGMNAISTADLRNNQIQQASIASQALTVKSALYAAQGNYSLAKDAADKAAQVAFDSQTQQINGLRAQLDAIKPTLDKEQAGRAALMEAQLNDRSNQIKVQQDNFKTGQAAIADAMQNNPDNSGAQFAAQQALKLDPSDPLYLQKVQSLVSKYSSDLTARALDQQLKNAQIAQSNASTAQARATTAKTLSEIAASTPATDQAISARSGTINTINTILGDPSLKFAVGLQTLNPLNSLPGSGAQAVKAQIEQVKGQLALSNRSQLKGSGAISDFESKTLDKAASAFNTSLPYDQAVDALKQVRGALTTLNGGTSSVLITLPSGESQVVNADTQGINAAIKDGATVKYQ
jgi:hypothetical protein